MSINFLIYINTCQDLKRSNFLIQTTESLWSQPYLLSTSRLPPLLLLRLPKNTSCIPTKRHIGGLPGFCSLTDCSKSHRLGSNQPLLLRSAWCPTPAFRICVQTNPFLQSRSQEQAMGAAQHSAEPATPVTSLPLDLLCLNRARHQPELGLSFVAEQLLLQPSPWPCHLCASSQLCLWPWLHHPKTLRTF